MDMTTFDVTWAHVILFYAKCGVILSENDFLGRERSDYLNEIINEILNPMDIQDYVSRATLGTSLKKCKVSLGAYAVIYIFR